MSGAKVVVKKGDEEITVLKWDDLIEMNKEVKKTLKEIIDELDKLKNELGEEVLKDDTVRSIIAGIEKEIEARFNDIKMVEKIHGKEIEVEENGRKVKKFAFFTGVIPQDPSDPNYNPKIFEAYLVAMNQYSNILAKMLTNFNIGKLVTVANSKLPKGEDNGTKE